MDPACLKCLQIRVVNRCLKGTYQEHSCAHTYIEFCWYLLNDEGHQCWRDILTELGVADPRSWIRYAVRFATLPLLPARLLCLPQCGQLFLHDTFVLATCAAYCLVLALFIQVLEAGEAK